MDIFAGYSYVRENPSTSGVNSFSLNGGSASFAYNATPWLSGVADFGGLSQRQYPEHRHRAERSRRISSGLAFPIVASGRVTPFGEVLFGVAHAGASVAGTSGTDNAFAMTLGGGVDYKLTDHFAIRPMKVDYLMTRFSETGNREPVHRTISAFRLESFSDSKQANARSVARCRQRGRAKAERGPLHVFCGGVQRVQRSVLQRVHHGDVGVDFDGLAVENVLVCSAIAERHPKRIAETVDHPRHLQGLNAAVGSDNGTQFHAAFAMDLSCQRADRSVQRGGSASRDRVSLSARHEALPRVQC